MNKSSFCYLCGKPIKFDEKHISETSGKKIPLDVDTQEAHDCPMWRNGQQQQQQSQHPQQTQRRYYQCNKGCGKLIYFDVNHCKSQSGKWVPLSKDTGQPHQCQ